MQYLYAHNLLPLKYSNISLKKKKNTHTHTHKTLNQRRKKHTHLPVETVQETAGALKALTALRQLIKCM
jgi:hypothetical protein